MKIVILIIASQSSEYDGFKREIQTYMNGVRERGYDVRHFFIYGHNAYDRCSHKYPDSDLVLPCQDNWRGGILAKTVLACRHILDTGIPFDYCIRSNLSALFHIPRLIGTLTNLPRQGCYAGCMGKVKQVVYVSGAAMVWSPDVVRLVAKESPPTVDCMERETEYDDVMLGRFLCERDIVPFHPKDWVRIPINSEHPAESAEHEFSGVQFRFKNQNRSDDVKNMNTLATRMLGWLPGCSKAKA